MACAIPIVCLDGITRRFELTDYGAIVERRFSPALDNVRFCDRVELGVADQDGDTEMEFTNEPVDFVRD